MPVRYRGYWYAIRYVTGEAVSRSCVRRADSPQARRSVLLDCNVLAAGQPFFQLGGYEVSPDNRLLAYTEDTVGPPPVPAALKDSRPATLLAT